MTTNDWSLLRDIFDQVATEHLNAVPPNTNNDPYLEAAALAYYTVHHAFRRVALEMQRRSDEMPNEQSAIGPDDLAQQTETTAK